MADRRVAMEFVQGRPRFAAPSYHASLVAGFGARLAGRERPLDGIPAEQREHARKEFAELPEVAGEPLPAPKPG
jgi:hypothetical protein